MQHRCSTRLSFRRSVSRCRSAQGVWPAFRRAAPSIPNTPGPDGHPEILPIHADANSKRIAGEYWHSDVSCIPEPPMGGILYLHTVPLVGGDTLFASMYAAYGRAIAADEVLSCGHDRNAFRRPRLSPSERAGRQGRDGAGLPDRRAPGGAHASGDGRKCLFVNPTFTTHINEVSSGEPGDPDYLRPQHTAGVPGAFPLAAELHGVLDNRWKSSTWRCGLLLQRSALVSGSRSRAIVDLNCDGPALLRSGAPSRKGALRRPATRGCPGGSLTRRR